MLSPWWNLSNEIKTKGPFSFARNFVPALGRQRIKTPNGGRKGSYYHPADYSKNRPAAAGRNNNICVNLDGETFSITAAWTFSLLSRASSPSPFAVVPFDRENQMKFTRFPSARPENWNISVYLFRVINDCSIIWFLFNKRLFERTKLRSSAGSLSISLTGVQYGQCKIAYYNQPCVYLSYFRIITIPSLFRAFVFVIIAVISDGIKYSTSRKLGILYREFFQSLFLNRYILL